MSPTKTARYSWSHLSLAQQFAVAGGLVMLLATVIVGVFVSQRIEDAVVRNTANTTALYMESFIAPLAQDLARADHLSPASLDALDKLLTETPLGQRVASFKLWIEGPRVIASSDPAIIGKTFAASENLKQAWSGVVRADFNDLTDPESRAEQALNLPLLEIYSPIRERGSGKVIAVAEFYEIGTQLKADLIRARLTSWAAVALALAAIFSLLFAVVLRGSRTIERQMLALIDMAARNVTLRLRVQGAAARFSALNDQAQRRIGADLHDGPAQLMGFAALRLDALRKHAAGDTAQHEIDSIENAVREAMREVRNISRGVSLPDIDRRPLDEVIQGLVDAHAARTGSAVHLQSVLGAEAVMPLAVKICVARVVQEGLTNAWRHAAGQGQEVEILRMGQILTVAVRDRGPGLPADAPEGVDRYGLGLAGLEGRVESLGGVLTLRNRRDGVTGTELFMTIDLGGVE